MKSRFLEAISDRDLAVKLLDEKLPGQSDPWLIRVGDLRDPMAFVHIVEGHAHEIQGPFSIQADISGRSYCDHDAVMQFLEELQRELGGVLASDE